MEAKLEKFKARKLVIPIGWSKAISFALAAALAVALSGCGKDPSSEPQEPGRAAPWQKMIRERHCKPPGSCGAEGPFSVTIHGEYQTEDGSTGRIEESELQSLRALADPVAPFVIQAERKCERAITITELKRATLSLAIGEDAPVLIRELDAESGQLCYRGDKSRNAELSDWLQNLMEKYSAHR